ncbi:zinc metallopeptidase [Candidatus Dojkabacteria bacterium]|nr:zinc metallopeptidase [Candidatus Dojkabacteria bacterium]
MYFDPLYLLILAPVLLFSFFVSILFKFWSNRYIQTPNSRNITGLDAVQIMTNQYQNPISINQTPGDFSDNFNPRNDILTLSRVVANRPSIASVAIAAHEYGHVRQKFEKNPLMLLRSLVVPVVNIGTNLGYILIIIGLLLALTNLAWMGFILFSLSTLFALLTLPIEIDASTKALGMIKNLNLLSDQEIPAAKRILFGASLTYFAALFSSLANLLYFAIRIQGSSRD